MWFTWTGTRIQLTLYLMAQAVGLACWDREIALGFDASSPDVLRLFGDNPFPDTPAPAAAKAWS